jgi:hypothetical protein
MPHASSAIAMPSGFLIWLLGDENCAGEPRGADLSGVHERNPEKEGALVFQRLFQYGEPSKALLR